MVTTLPKPQSEVDQTTGVTQAQEAHQAAIEGLAGVLARMDEIRADASEADGILEKVDASVGRAKWAGKETIKPHQASEGAGRVKWECEAALELAPSKLREALRALWAAELAHEQALIDSETVEAQEGRERALVPFLASGYALEQAEQALTAVNRQPSGPTPSIQIDSEGGWQYTQPPVLQVVEIKKPQWLFLVEDRIPSRRKHVLGLGKQIQTVGDRTLENLEKTSRKLTAQP